MGLYPIEPQYDLSTWYDYAGMNDLWTGTDLQLDLTRYIINSGAYVFQGIAFPKGNDIMIPEATTFSGTVNLLPYSYIVSLTAWSGNGGQFTIRIYDKGAQSDIYYSQFAWYPTVASNMTGTFNEGLPIIQNDKDKPYGPYFFRDPLIVLPPGVLQIQLTNVATEPVTPPFGFPPFFQLFFNVAVPKNTQTMQSQAMQTATDQTGTQSLGAAGAITTVVGG